MGADRANLENLVNRQNVSRVELAELSFADRNSLLLLASQRGNLDLVEVLTQLGADLNTKNAQGATALHIAASRKHLHLLSFLLENSANVNVLDDKHETPLLKVVRSHQDLECISALIRYGADLWCENLDLQCCMDYLFLIDLSDTDWLEAISNDLHCGIFTRMKAPILFLNKISTPRPGRQPVLVEFFQSMLQRQDCRLLKRLLLWYIALCDAASHHVGSSADLVEYAGFFKAMVLEVFRCDSMDEPWNVQVLLQPDLSTFFPQCHSLLKYQLHSLQSNGLLSLCIRRECKFLFEISQVGGFIEDLFWRSPRFELLASSPASASPSAAPLSPLSPLSSLESLDVIFRCLRAPIMASPIVRLTYGMRACPGVRCGSDGVSRVVLVFLVAKVAIYQYGASCGQDYSDASCSAGVWSPAEYLCALYTVGITLRAVGELHTAHWSCTAHFRNEWNLIDAVSLVFLFVWLDSRSTDISAARVALSTAAIPLTLGLLRYLTLSRSLGVMVCIARAMLFDMLGFAIVYVVCGVGFAIFFQSSFYGTDDFSDFHQTFLSLFSFSLGNVDYTVFDTHNERVNSLGETALTLFVVLTAILLMNLLVARMANAYSRVDGKGREEWCFSYAHLVQSFLLLRDDHPLCMLPPPLNVLTAAVWPLHLAGLRRGWSLGGSLANAVYHLPAGVIRAAGVAVACWPALRGVARTFATGWAKTPWRYSAGYLASNALAGAVVAAFLAVTAACPLAVDVCCAHVPRGAGMWEEVVDGVPKYLLLTLPQDESWGDGTEATRDRQSRSTEPGIQLAEQRPSPAPAPPEGTSSPLHAARVSARLSAQRVSWHESAAEALDRDPSMQAAAGPAARDGRGPLLTEADVRRILRHFPSYLADAQHAAAPPLDALHERLAALQDEVQQSRAEVRSLRDQVRDLAALLRHQI